MYDPVSNKKPKLSLKKHFHKNKSIGSGKVSVLKLKILRFQY